MGLNWFIPALVKRRVGSLWGTTEDEGTVKYHSLAQFLPKDEKRKQDSLGKESLGRWNPLRLSSLKLLQSADNPPRTNSMALPLKILQKLLPNHRSGPFRLRARHCHNTLLKASKCESVSCGCSRAQSKSR